LLVPNKIAVELFLTETNFPCADQTLGRQGQKRSIPNMKSRATVIEAKSKSDPRQPNRLEKKKNTPRYASLPSTIYPGA
jgi:hypothetical protein